MDSKTKRPLVEPFPMKALPLSLRRYVVEASDSLDVAPELVAVPLLAVCSGLIGNARVLELKEGWSEPAVLWALIVAPSGDKKSPALDSVLRPLKRIESDLHEKYRRKMLAHRRKRRDFDRKLKAWIRTPDKRQPREPREPKSERLSVDDASLPAVASLLRDNPRGLLLAQDELSGWIHVVSKNASHWLEMHGARSLTVDRKSHDEPVIHVRNAALSVVGGIQPGVLDRIMNQKLVDGGFLARFLVALAEPRTARWTETRLDRASESELQSLYLRLRALEPDRGASPGSIEPRTIRLGPGAKERWIDFHNRHEKEGEELEDPLALAWPKLTGCAARLALVLHCVREALGRSRDPTLISTRTMEAAIEFADWFGGQARRLYCNVLREVHEKTAQELARTIELEHHGQVAVRDWQRRKGHASAREARLELGRLEAAGLGRLEQRKPGRRGGRPTEIFVLRRCPKVRCARMRLVENGRD